MSRDTRTLLYWAATLVLGVALFAAWIYFVYEIQGQSECDDRGECSWIGDLTYGTSASIPLAACFVIAAAVVWGVPRLVRRIARREPVGR